MKNKKIHIIFSLLFLIYSGACAQNIAWTVIGAGPAGITTIGFLLDNNVLAEDILWIDPTFTVGKLGTYENVPGNSTVLQYKEYLTSCKLFAEHRSPAVDCLLGMPSTNTPELRYIITPLQEITELLKQKVHTLVDEVVSLQFKDNLWHVGTKNAHVQSECVVLAIGSHPKMPAIACIDNKCIPLDQALDKSTLAKYLEPNDTIAVIGSAHSALLITRYLTELNVKEIINFYKHPIVFPTPINGDLAYREAGIKGELVTWIKTVLEVNPPSNLKRIPYNPATIENDLAHCSKVIYACGFERNEFPEFNDTTSYANYHPTTGLIAPRLFGVGIAFPERKVDPLGNVEYLVGVPYFWPYLKRIAPEMVKSYSLYKTQS